MTCSSSRTWVHTGLLALLGDLLGLDHVSFFQFKETKSQTLVVEKGTLHKGSGAKIASLPCENHVRRLQTFFTVQVLLRGAGTFSGGFKEMYLE